MRDLLPSSPVSGECVPRGRSHLLQGVPGQDTKGGRQHAFEVPHVPCKDEEDAGQGAGEVDYGEIVPCFPFSLIFRRRKHSIDFQARRFFGGNANVNLARSRRPSGYGAHPARKDAGGKERLALSKITRKPATTRS